MQSLVRRQKLEQESYLEKGLLVGGVVGIVEEGNRLVKFEYEGIFEEILTSSTGCYASVYYIHFSWKIRIVIRLFIQAYRIRALAPTTGLHFGTGIIKRDRRKRH